MNFFHLVLNACRKTNIMDTSWISSATSGMLHYVYNSITGDDESAATHRTRNATICKGMVVTDLPTNNYEPLEVSHARAMAKKVRVAPPPSSSFCFFLSFLLNFSNQ